MLTLVVEAYRSWKASGRGGKSVSRDAVRFLFSLLTSLGFLVGPSSASDPSESE